MSTPRDLATIEKAPPPGTPQVGDNLWSKQGAGPPGPSIEGRHLGCADSELLRGREENAALERAALALSAGGLVGTWSLHPRPALRPAWTRACDRRCPGPSGLGRSSPRLTAGEALATSQGARRPLSLRQPGRLCAAVLQRCEMRCAAARTPPRWRAISWRDGEAAGWRSCPPSCSETVVIAEVDRRRAALSGVRGESSGGRGRVERRKPARRRGDASRTVAGSGRFGGDSEQPGAPVEGRRSGPWVRAAQADLAYSAGGSLRKRIPAACAEAPLLDGSEAEAALAAWPTCASRADRGARRGVRGRASSAARGRKSRRSEAPVWSGAPLRVLRWTVRGLIGSRRASGAWLKLEGRR